jgi:hypothetical protein
MLLCIKSICSSSFGNTGVRDCIKLYKLWLLPRDIRIGTDLRSVLEKFPAFSHKFDARALLNAQQLYYGAENKSCPGWLLEDPCTNPTSACSPYLYFAIRQAMTFESCKGAQLEHDVLSLTWPKFLTRRVTEKLSYFVVDRCAKMTDTGLYATFPL